MSTKNFAHKSCWPALMKLPGALSKRGVSSRLQTQHNKRQERGGWCVLSRVQTLKRQWAFLPGVCLLGFHAIVCTTSIHPLQPQRVFVTRNGEKGGIFSLCNAKAPSHHSRPLHCHSCMSQTGAITWTGCTLRPAQASPSRALTVQEPRAPLNST